MSDEDDSVEARWGRLRQCSAAEFIAHCEQYKRADGITLPLDTHLSATEPLHADQALLRKVTFDRTHPWPGTRFEGAGLYECRLPGVRFDPPAKWRKARIVACDLQGAILRGADLTDAVFDSTFLQGADLRGAKLLNVRFLNVTFDEKTQLAGADMENVRIERRALEQLGGKRALDKEQRRRIEVIDPAKDLHESFGRRTAFLLHLGFFLAFLAPYLYFLVKARITGTPCPADAACTTAPEQLVDYILRLATKADLLRWITSAICLGYNTLRVVLLVKAFLLRRAIERTSETALERYEHSRWPKVHTVAGKLFVFNLLATLGHGVAWFLEPIEAVRRS